MTERAMLTVDHLPGGSETYTVWFVPFESGKGADYASGDCSFMNMGSIEEALAFMHGYNEGAKAR